MTIKACFVRLLGISKTSTGTYENHSEKVHESSSVFLEFKKDLSKELSVMQDRGRCGFDVWFPFPDDRTTRSCLGFSNDPNMYWLFEVPQPQTLPPSGNFDPGNTIVYKFEVNVVEEGSDRRIKAEQQLTFSTTRNSPVSDPKLITTVQQKRIDHTARFDDPQYLTLGLKCAGEVVQGEPLSLWVSLADKNEPSPAKVLLKSSSVQLIEKTAIQGDGDLRYRWIDKHVITSRIFESDLPIITTRAMNLGALLDDPSIPLDHPPSFSSTNIQRTYGISISLRVEAGGCDTYEV